MLELADTRCHDLQCLKIGFGKAHHNTEAVMEIPRE